MLSFIHRFGYLVFAAVSTLPRWLIVAKQRLQPPRPKKLGLGGKPPAINPFLKQVRPPSSCASS